MSENLIETVTTKNDFKSALKKIGVGSDDICLVHTALSKFGFVPGGPEALVRALEETLNEGALMMPSQVSMNCDPATWEYPPVRKDLLAVVRDNMPPYDPATSATEGLGVTPEYFRTLPEVYRSSHPYLPLAIWGKNAQLMAKNQPLNLPYGFHSPLDYLYRHNGKTIFFATDYETCTVLHYAESTIGRKTEDCYAATAVDEHGKTIWTKYKNVDLDSYDDFNELGLAFEQKFTHEVRQIKLHHAMIKVVNVRPLINFAREWFTEKDLKSEFDH